MTFDRSLHFKCECGNVSSFIWDMKEQEIICLVCGLVIIRGREEVLYERLIRSGSTWQVKNLHLQWKS
jgi:transcription initiation factor TFIIIB Brf1 subunit/transcription initiation factor TFIIB